MASVLIVDDDTDLLEMVAMALSTHGFATTSISDGKTFIDTVSTVKPDVILLDVFLGDIDGRKLCQKLKTETPFTNIPVILYSAGNISMRSIMESAANAFFPKPFSIKQLTEKISSLL